MHMDVREFAIREWGAWFGAFQGVMQMQPVLGTHSVVCRIAIVAISL